MGSSVTARECKEAGLRLCKPASTIAGVIAVSLLTLVPGRLGGSETYVRELLRGLGRSGSHSYRVVLPPVAPDAGEGLPSVVAREYRRASSTPERLLAMGLASARPGRLTVPPRGRGASCTSH